MGKGVLKCFFIELLMVKGVFRVFFWRGRDLVFNILLILLILLVELVFR